MEETKPKGCKWDTEAKLDRHTQRQTQTTLYMEHKGRDSDRQSFRRGGEREGSQVGIYQPSAQHLRCPPLPILLSAAQKYLSGKISHKMALNRWILRWKRSVNRYKTVEMWESGVYAAVPGGWVGGPVNVVGGRSEGRWIFHGHFYPSYKGTLHLCAYCLNLKHSWHQLIRYSTKMYLKVTCRDLETKLICHLWPEKFLQIPSEIKVASSEAICGLGLGRGSISDGIFSLRRCK